MVDVFVELLSSHGCFLELKLIFSESVEICDFKVRQLHFTQPHGNHVKTENKYVSLYIKNGGEWDNIKDYDTPSIKEAIDQALEEVAKNL